MTNRKIRRTFKLDEFAEQATDALGSAPGLDIELDNGEHVTIPHPMLVDDDTQAAVERVQRKEDLDHGPDGELLDTIDGQPAGPFSVRFAKAVLGEAEYKRFSAGGGNANHIGLAWQYLTKGLEDPKLLS